MLANIIRDRANLNDEFINAFVDTLNASCVSRMERSTCSDTRAAIYAGIALYHRESNRWERVAVVPLHDSGTGKDYIPNRYNVPRVMGVTSPTANADAWRYYAPATDSDMESGRFTVIRGHALKVDRNRAFVPRKLAARQLFPEFCADSIVRDMIELAIKRVPAWSVARFNPSMWEVRLEVRASVSTR